MYSYSAQRPPVLGNGIQEINKEKQGNECWERRWKGHNGTLAPKFVRSSNQMANNFPSRSGTLTERWTTENLQIKASPSACFLLACSQHKVLTNCLVLTACLAAVWTRYEHCNKSNSVRSGHKVGANRSLNVPRPPRVILQISTMIRLLRWPSTRNTVLLEKLRGSQLFKKKKIWMQWKLKVHVRVDKSPSAVAVVSQMNVVSTFVS